MKKIKGELVLVVKGNEVVIETSDEDYKLKNLKKVIKRKKRIKIALLFNANKNKLYELYKKQNKNKSQNKTSLIFALP